MSRGDGWTGTSRKPASRCRSTDPQAVPCSPEGESVSLHAGVEEPDLERMVGDRAALPDELVEALPRHDAVARFIDIAAMVVAGRGAVDRDAKSHGLAVRTGPEHQVKIAGVEDVDDSAIALVE